MKSLPSRKQHVCTLRPSTCMAFESQARLLILGVSQGSQEEDRVVGMRPDTFRSPRTSAYYESSLKPVYPSVDFPPTHSTPEARFSNKCNKLMCLLSFSSLHIASPEHGLELALLNWYDCSRRGSLLRNKHPTSHCWSLVSRSIWASLLRSSTGLLSKVSFFVLGWLKAGL